MSDCRTRLGRGPGVAPRRASARRDHHRIECVRGSTLFHPGDHAARAATQCLIDLQRRTGCDALVGRRTFPLTVEPGFAAIRVDPGMVCVDSVRPRSSKASGTGPLRS